MKRNLRILTTFIIAVLLFTGIGCGQRDKRDSLASTSTQAQAESPSAINNVVIRSRAVQAIIWGMPAVNYDLMLHEMLTKTTGKVGQVIYWGRPLDYHNQTLTPNPDALYFMVFFNTKDGPVVLDLPPGDENGSFNGNIVTTWQMPLEDAGLLGYDHGQRRKIPRASSGLSRQSVRRLYPTPV